MLTLLYLLKSIASIRDIPLKYITCIVIGSFLLSAASCGGGSSGAGAPSGTGSSTVKLSWVVPTQRVNGNALLLNEIKGYQFCYTIDGGSEACEVFDVTDPAQSEYAVADLDVGIYRITLATIDTNNIYSGKSAVLQHTIN
ncbi:MAG: hypothetical protein ACJAS1_002091 [Oleiphilaceae bacterium]|jgi:hypothetical protein